MFIHNYHCKHLSYFMESGIEMFYFTIKLNQVLLERGRN
jgi:hypothetical protein